MSLFNPRQSSDNSFKESVLMVSKLVKWAKELGWETVGIADSSNYHGFLQFGKATAKEGVKPVLGIILKVSLGADVGEFLVIAKNEKGLAFVREAVSKAFTSEADNRVVPYQSLVGSKDVFVLSGGIGSFIGQAWSGKSEATEAKLRQTEVLASLVQNHKTPSAVVRKVLSEDEIEIAKSRGLKGETLRSYLLETLAGRKRHLHQSMLAAKNSSEERAESALAKFAKDFGSDFFVEIVRGYSGELKKENDRYNAFAVGLAKKLGVGLVASVPTFYATPSKKRAWLVNKANDIGLTVGELGKLDSGDFHMRSPEEFLKTFSDVPEALEGNSRIAEKCSWSVGKFDYQTPVVKIEDPEILAKYREYSDRWARDGFEPLSLNSFYVRYYCTKNLWKKYGIDFDENETYFMVSVDKKERKTSKELQAMEEENLIDYAATLWPERKRRIVEAKNQRVQAVVRRFDYEFLVIEAMGFADYFVIVADFINWAKNNGIPVGPGRGSAPGSMLAYLMDITDVEPMKYGLLFTRFLNINRISYPDIDTDFANRDPLVEYCRQKYGEDHVAQVCTFGTMGAKGALKDVFRVYQVPHYRSQELSNMIGKTQSLSEAYDENPTFRSEIEADPIIKEAFEAARDLEGVKRQIGIHACAVVITPKPVSEYCVVQAQSGDKDEAPKIVTQLEGPDAESIGLIKMDFLGISSLAVIGSDLDWAIADVERMEGKKIDLLKIDLEDKEVLSNIYAKADTDGVFQFESQGMKKYLKELAPDRFDDVVAMVALYRPGPMDYIGGQEADPSTGKEFKPSYIKRKNGTEKIEYVDPDLRNSLQNTQGLCVHGDTRVSFSDGTSVKIRDMHASPSDYMGKKVLSFDQKTKTVVSRAVSGIFHNGTKPFYEIRFGKFDFIKTTGDHKMYVYDSLVGEVVKKETSKLTKTDFLLSPKVRIDVSAQKHDKDELTIMAYLLADGHICTGAVIEFANKDIRLINAFKESVKRRFPTSNCSVYESTKAGEKTGVMHVIVQDPANRNYRGQDTLLNFLRNAGLKERNYKVRGLDSGTKFIPESVLNDTIENRAFFLAKLWDCDGGVSKRGDSYYTTISGKLESWVAYLAKSVGFEISRYEHPYESPSGKKSVAYKVQVRDSRKFLSTVGKYILSESKLERLVNAEEFDSRAMSIPSRMLRDWILKNFEGRSFRSLDDERRTLHSCLASVSFSSVRFENAKKLLGDKMFSEKDRSLVENFDFRRVEEIVEIGQDEAFDLEIEDTHNYVADGLVVSNCVFQESLMQMVRDYAGFSMGEADILRKAVGKKKRELVDEQKVVFMEKAGKRGKDLKVADKIWRDVVEPFAGYGFNKSHAVAYSMLSFQTAYLKHYHRAAFMANLLTVMAKEWQPEDKTTYIRNAIETGVSVLPPDVNASETRFFPIDRKTIRCGFVGIKGLGRGGDAIVSERKERGQFKSVVDFAKRMGKKLSKSDYVALARCGALDSFGNEREDLVASAQEEYFVSDPEKGVVPKVISVKKSEDWMAERYVNETALLGEYLSPHPISGYKSSFRTSFVGAEGFHKKQNGRFRCFGIVTSKLEKTSKTGTKFGIISVETADFAFEALAFNEAWRNSKAHVDAFRVVKVSWEVKFEGEEGRRAVFLKDIESYPMTQFFDAMKDDRSDSEKEKVDRTSLLLDFSGKRTAKFIKIKASEKDRLKDVASKLAELPFGYDLPVFEIENSDGSKTTYPYPKTVDITPLLKKKEEEGKEGS